MNSEELREAFSYYLPQVFSPSVRTPGEMVREFHETYGQPVGEVGSPMWLTKEREALRLSLIEEEYLDELRPAVKNADMIETVDALADLVYVIYGFAVELGVDLDEVIAEVHRSNMSKLDAEGNPIYREDGKVLKGPNFSEPDIADVIYD